MPPMETGAAPGTVAGIPTKWLLIGGGGLLVAYILISRQGGGSSGQSDVATGDATYGSALGPNAALALGSLQSQMLQQSGIMQEQWAGYYDELTDTLDQQAKNLSDTEGRILGTVEETAFWQGAQRRGELLNIRAGIEGWTEKRLAAESRVYAEQMAQTRPDLAPYFRENWDQRWASKYDWNTVTDWANTGA